MRIIHIADKEEVSKRKFLGFPETLYRDVPQWVPPLEADAKAMLDRTRHPFYKRSDAAFFLAVDDNDCAIGRLAVLDPRPYNMFNREETAFFYLFECVDDLHVSAELFSAGFAWARDRKLTRIIGPKGFTALDGMGLLVKGFEHRPALGIPYNPAYYERHLEAAGFRTKSEVVSGYLDARAPLPAQIRDLSERVQKRRGLQVLRFRSRRELARWVPRLQQLYNDSLQGTTGNAPLSDDEARMMADQILWFADPALIKIIVHGEEPVGFLFAYPDISAALQRTGGRLFPFGWADLLLELRRTRWVNINGAGISAKYRGLGGTAILFDEMERSIRSGRFEHADLVQVGADNANMQRELRDLGIDFYKTHRLYEKDLQPAA